MKIVITGIFFSAIAVACALPSEVEPTLRPTYTPYPNVPAANTNSNMRELGDKEWFVGAAAAEIS